jgi:hypothetical protein
MNQKQLREGLKNAMREYLIEQDMPYLLDCLVPSMDINDPGRQDIDKAMDSAYFMLNNSLKQISRIAVRLGYIDKQNTTRQSLS